MTTNAKPRKTRLVSLRMRWVVPLTPRPSYSTDGRPRTRIRAAARDVGGTDLDQRTIPARRARGSRHDVNMYARRKGWPFRIRGAPAQRALARGRLRELRENDVGVRRSSGRRAQAHSRRARQRFDASRTMPDQANAERGMKIERPVLSPMPARNDTRRPQRLHRGGETAASPSATAPSYARSVR